MVGIVIVTHGNMAHGILESMQMITGEQAQVVPIILEEDKSPEDLSELIKHAIKQVDNGNGVLIMVDLFGATPFNVSARLYMESDHSLEVVTGLNLPMLVETVITRGENDLNTVFEIAQNAGISGIKSIPDNLRKK